MPQLELTEIIDGVSESIHKAYSPERATWPSAERYWPYHEQAKMVMAAPSGVEMGPPASQQEPLELTLLVDRYSVLRLDPIATPLTALSKIIATTSNPTVVSPNSSLVNLSITPGEISVVLPTVTILQDADDFCPQAVERGWLAFRVEPPTPGQGIDFGVVGIMARVSGALAKAEVSLFAVSTFDTDYVLVKEDRVAVAVRALREDACTVLLEDSQNGLWTDLGLRLLGE